MAERVVVTGIGTVGPFGAGLDALRAGLREGKPRTTSVDTAAGYHRGGDPSRACLTGKVDLSARLTPIAARRMSPPSRYAVFAALEALEQAGLDSPEAADPQTSVIIGTAYGPSSFTERMLRQIMAEGAEFASPFLFAECVANAPAAQIALLTKSAGPNQTLCQREATPLLALARAVTDLRTGRARRALVGNCDEMTPLLHALLARFDVLARAGAGDAAECARPFDAGRDGLTAGEGASVMLLERESDARDRGARPLAAILATGRAFDPTASRVGWGTGERALAAALTARLDTEAIALDSIDRVVSGASGAIAGDRLEAGVLRALWRETPPAIHAPKSIVGEYGGGFLAAAVLAAAGEPMPATYGFRRVDPALDVRPHDGTELPAPTRTLVSSLAAGGAAAWAVLDRVDA